MQLLKMVRFRKTGVRANVYNGMGEALECDAYQGINMLEHALKICKMWLVSDVRGVLMGSCFEKL